MGIAISPIKNRTRSNMETLMVAESSRDIALPEDIIAMALSLTSPRDACRMSLVDSTFRSASQSDVIWSRFLPSDYRDIVSRASHGDSLLSMFPSMKELYLHLSDHPIIIDEGRKSFSLDKVTGKKCYMLGAVDLVIFCGDVPDNLRIIKVRESRFSKVIELLNVGGFIVLGKMSIHMLSSATTYAAYLVFTLKSSSYGAEASLCMSSLIFEKRIVYLELGPVGREGPKFEIIPGHFPTDMIMWHPQRRNDGWMEVELGGCFVNGDESGDLMVQLVVKGGNQKSSLIIQGIEIRPGEL